MASICCSPPLSVAPAWCRRWSSTGKSEDRVHVRAHGARSGAASRPCAGSPCTLSAAEDAPALGALDDAEVDDVIRARRA